MQIPLKRLCCVAVLMAQVSAFAGGIYTPSSSTSGEPAAGNPAADGYIWSSTAAGARSWKDPGTLIINSIKDSTDPTKILNIDISAFTTGNTKTLTFDNAGTVSLSSIGATTVGGNLVRATNPSAITFPKVAADNSVSFRTPAQVLSDIGAQASGSYAASGSNGDITSMTGLTGAITHTQNALGAATADGSILKNTTASTSSVQQWSPAVHQTAHGWHSNGTPSDNTYDLRAYLSTVSTGDSAALGGNGGVYRWDGQFNGGGYTNLMSLDFNGHLTVNGNLIYDGTNLSASGLSITGGSGVILNSSMSRVQSFSDGTIRTSNNASSLPASIYQARNVSAKTGNYTVTSLGDANNFFTNTGASGEVDFTLPTASAGLTYSFYVDAAQTLKIIAGASTTIQVAGSTSASAGNITNATIGGCITLVAISSTKWVTESHEGTWTVN